MGGKLVNEEGFVRLAMFSSRRTKPMQHFAWLSCFTQEVAVFWKGLSSVKRRLPAGRKAEIEMYVSRSGEVTVTQLAERFQVSVDTIRRDLDTLADLGVVTRTHGGAISNEDSTEGILHQDEVRMDLRMGQREEAKARIGAAAARLVENGQSILLGSGTTALSVAANLGAHRDLIVVTNNLVAPKAVNPNSVHGVYVIGGEVRLDGQVTIGPVELNSIAGGNRAFRCDYAFIGVGAVDMASGFTTTYPAEAQMMNEMMRLAHKVVVLADSSKLGKTQFAQVASLDEVDLLVTDEEPDLALRDALNAAQVSILLAK